MVPRLIGNFCRPGSSEFIMENVHTLVSHCPDFIMVFHVSVLYQMFNPLSPLIVTCCLTIVEPAKEFSWVVGVRVVCRRGGPVPTSYPDGWHPLPSTVEQVIWP